MTAKTLTTLSLLGFIFLFSRCKKDDPAPIPTLPEDVCEANTYCFVNNGEFTVDLFRQLVFYNQLDEIEEYIGTTADLGLSSSFGQLQAYHINFVYFNVEENTWYTSFDGISNFQGSVLDDIFPTSTESTFLNELSNFTDLTSELSFASEGTAGILISTQNSNNQYFINENGYVFRSLIRNRYMSEAFLHQINNVLFNDILNDPSGYEHIDSLNYSMNEHRADQVYGFIGLNNFSDEDNFGDGFARMSQEVDHAIGSSDILFETLLDLRTNVTNENSTSVSENILSLQNQLSKIIGARIILHLKEAINNTSDQVIYFKHLTTAMELINGLKNLGDASVSQTSVVEAQSIINTNFYASTESEINACIQWMIDHTEISQAEADLLD